MEKLSEKEWKAYAISELFNVSGSITTKPEALIKIGKTPRITCAATNNGLDKCYGNLPTEQRGVLTVDSATVGTVFYQPFDFIATDHVEEIHAKDGYIDDCEGLFICAALKSSIGNKYEYGYKFSQSRIKKQYLFIPVRNTGNPDYEYMRKYIHNLKIHLIKQYYMFAYHRIAKIGKEIVIPPLIEKKWSEFILENIFTIDSGVRLESRNKQPGDRPFIGAADNNNGVTGFVSNTNDSLDKDVLGVNYNGNGMCIGFYHPYECIFSDDVKRFHLKHWNDNEYVMLFLKVVILQQKSKFGYLYKFNAKRMAKQRLLLPVTDSGEPDYQYMEQYAKNMMLKKYHQYLAFIRKHYPNLENEANAADQ